MIASIRDSSSSATSSSVFVARLLEQQLEVAAGDRQRRAQLVRGVVDETLLALEHRAALLGARLRDLERIVAAVGVPHHQQDDHDQQRERRR